MTVYLLEAVNACVHVCVYVCVVHMCVCVYVCIFVHIYKSKSLAFHEVGGTFPSHSILHFPRTWKETRNVEIFHLMRRGDRGREKKKREKRREREGGEKK